MRGLLRSLASGMVVLSAITLSTVPADAYSILTHEELVDLAWNGLVFCSPCCCWRSVFRELPTLNLRRHTPMLTAVAPFRTWATIPSARKFFSDLTHYVRSGDFIAWLFRNARSINEYAFAIGALSHYLGDSLGHLEAINPATGVEFPKLSRKFGPDVTYDQSPHGHVRTEFAFDVEQASRKAFAPPAYLEFIGFKAPRKFLAQAFIDTYGFDIHEVLGEARPALRSYTTSARRFLPAFAEAEVVLHRHQFLPPPDDEAYRIFAERVARTNYDRRWKHTYRGPGFKAHILALFVFIVPKVGPAADLAIKIPNHDTEELYLAQSVNHTVDSLPRCPGKIRKLRTENADCAFPILTSTPAITLSEVNTAAPTRLTQTCCGA